MKKKILFFVIAFAFFCSFGTSFVRADTDVVPEINGDYQDPENSHQRVKVFVHKVKNQTVESMACVDSQSNSVVSAAGWKLPSSVTYNLNVSSVPAGVGSQNWPTIAANSFGVWQQSISGKTIFVKGVNTKTNRQSGDGQNILAWGRTNGSALAVTYTRYNTATKQVVDVDTIMNQKFAWNWSSNSCGVSGTYDAQNILTHELGHWVGLNDHYTSEYTENTMYGYGATFEVKKDTLTSGDIAGAQSIYQ